MKKSRVFYKSYKKQGDQVLLEEALLLLTTCCQKHHQQPVWILLDEYDAPFTRSLFARILGGIIALYAQSVQQYLQEQPCSVSRGDDRYFARWQKRAYVLRT